MNRQPTIPGEINKIKEVQHQLNTQPGKLPEQHLFQVTAAHQGALGVNAKTNTWRPRQDCTLLEGTIELDQVATGQLEIFVYRNTDSIGSIIVPIGCDEATTIFSPPDASYTRETKLRLQVSGGSGGSGYSFVTVHLVFQTYKDSFSGVLIFDNGGGGG